LENFFSHKFNCSQLCTVKTTLWKRVLGEVLLYLVFCPFTSIPASCYCLIVSMFVLMICMFFHSKWTSTTQSSKWCATLNFSLSLFSLIFLMTYFKARFWNNDLPFFCSFSCCSSNCSANFTVLLMFFPWQPVINWNWKQDYIFWRLQFLQKS